jgi:prepilin-type N-terminal cleavage/methylation domain-containing protein
MIPNFEKQSRSSPNNGQSRVLARIFAVPAGGNGVAEFLGSNSCDSRNITEHNMSPNTFQSGRIRSRKSGFTLVEVMIAVGALVLLTVTCFSGIAFNRMSSLKAKEEGVATDFLIHYGEMIKGMRFSDVAAGMPINPLFDGTSGKPNIPIPANASWVSINTADYETFHPDLIWLHNLNPKLQVTIAALSSSMPLDRCLKIKVAWDPPLGKGTRITNQLCVVRTRDL